KSAHQGIRTVGSPLPAEWWLTEFEYLWPYKLAPGDVYFSLGRRTMRGSATAERKFLLRPKWDRHASSLIGNPARSNWSIPLRNYCLGSYAWKQDASLTGPTLRIGWSR